MASMAGGTCRISFSGGGGVGGKTTCIPDLLYITEANFLKVLHVLHSNVYLTFHTTCS